MLSTDHIPNGFKMNACGHLVPVSQIKDIDKLRDELIEKLVKEAKTVQAQMAQFKTQSMSEITAFLDLSAAEFDVKFGGAKGNLNLVSFDGKYKVQRSIGEHRIFDERIQAAKAKVDECILRWSEGSSDQIKALIEMSFRVNKQGHIDVNQVLSLRNLNIDDPDWLSAMAAIADSISVVGKTAYLRIYERDSQGAYNLITLDMSKL